VLVPVFIFIYNNVVSILFAVEIYKSKICRFAAALAAASQMWLGAQNWAS